MFYGIRKLYRPEFYQGPDRLRPYFEGWYFKAVTTDRSFAIIPGVSRAAEDPHAFIQFNDGTAGEATYHRFPLEEFSYRRDVFGIAIGENRFSLEGYSVRLPEISCDLKISNRTGWPSTLFSPGTMGWYSFVPFMECRHGIIVMDAELGGTVNGSAVEGGRFYLEKDYGRSFPNAWIWLQSNSFGSPGTSVTCSIANVPFVGGAFTGFLAGILHHGELHRFTTYTGAKMESLSVEGNEVAIVLASAHKRLEIHAVREEGAELVAPSDGVMNGRVSETMASRVAVRLVIEGEERVSGTGSHAGLEVVAPERLSKGETNVGISR